MQLRVGPWAAGPGRWVFAWGLCALLAGCDRIGPWSAERSHTVSAVIERRAFRISVMRPDGTPMSSDSRFALSLRAASSRFSSRPGCATGVMVYPLR